MKWFTFAKLIHLFNLYIKCSSVPSHIRFSLCQSKSDNSGWIMYNDTDLSGENIVLCNTEHCFYVDFRLCFVFKNIFKV